MFSSLEICIAVKKSPPLLLTNRLLRMTESGKPVSQRHQGGEDKVWKFSLLTESVALCWRQLSGGFPYICSFLTHAYLHGPGMSQLHPCRGTQLSVANFVCAFAHSTEIYKHIASPECWSQKIRKALLQLTVPDQKMYLFAPPFSWFWKNKMVFSKRYLVLWPWKSKVFSWFKIQERQKVIEMQASRKEAPGQCSDYVFVPSCRCKVGF